MDTTTLPIPAATEHALRVQVRERGDSRVVSIAGEASVWDAGPLKAEFSAIAEARPARVVIDLAECTLLSSLAVAAIIELYRRVRAHGGTVCVAAARPPVLEIIRILRLEQLIPVHADVDEALGVVPLRASA
jgi:anti-sigma B factor antagonist